MVAGHFRAAAAAAQLLFIASLLGFASNSHAQVIPDAGSALRDVHPAPGTILPPTPRSLPEKPPTQNEVLATGPTMTVQTFRFEGNKRYGAAELSGLLKGYLNRPLHLSDLESAAAVITRHYRAHGWLARVLVPPQTIDHGEVTLRVIEAIYGKTRFDDAGAGSQYLSAARILNLVQERQQPDTPFYIPDVERGLLIADDTPGVAITGSQIAGDTEGETDVVLKAQDAARLFGDVSFDDYNSRTLGAERLSGRIGINSPFGLGEEFDAQTQLAADLQYFRLAASFPLGHDGLRLLADVSTLRYSIGTAQFHALDAYGDMNTAGAGLSYPLLRANDRNLSVSLSVERRDPYNTSIVGTLSNYHINEAVLQFNGNWVDPLGGNLAAGLAVVHGQVDLGSSPNQASDAAGPDTQGGFTVLRYQLGRSQPLAGPLSFYLSAHGQTTHRNLDSSEDLYLGGPSAVRAYPVNEAGGASGVLASIELRWALPSNPVCACTVAPLFDWGRVTTYEHSFTAEPTPVQYSLKGYGLSLSAQGPWGTNLALVISHRIGGNPAALPNGQDQDGSLDKLRVWAALSTSF